MMTQLNDLQATGYVSGTIAKPHFEGGFVGYIRITSDSMTPTIPGGSIILINEIQPGSLLRIKMHEPMAFEHIGRRGDYCRFVGRVTFVDAIKNRMQISCDNPYYGVGWIPLAGITRMFTIDDIINPDDKAAFLKRVRV